MKTTTQSTIKPRVRKDYLIPDALWNEIKPLLPKQVTHHPLGCHRKRVEDRSAMRAIFFVRRDRRAEGGVEEPAIAGRRPGEAGDASRRKVIVGAVSHRVVVQRCGRRTNRGVITCRVMRVHFGVTMAEMHHEHSDTPSCRGCFFSGSK